MVLWRPMIEPTPAFGKRSLTALEKPSRLLVLDSGRAEMDLQLINPLDHPDWDELLVGQR